MYTAYFGCRPYLACTGCVTPYTKTVKRLTKLRWCQCRSYPGKLATVLVRHLRIKTRTYSCRLPRQAHLAALHIPGVQHLPHLLKPVSIASSCSNARLPLLCHPCNSHAWALPSPPALPIQGPVTSHLSPTKLKLPQGKVLLCLTTMYLAMTVLLMHSWQKQVAS